MVRQLVSAAAALHGSAPDVGNGAIAPERLVLTPAGRLTVVEYVLGAALEQLGHTRARYWRELAVALPGTVGTPVFDARTDVTQVGAVALALIIGRPLTPEDYPERLIDLIQTATMRTAAGVAEPLPESVRDWLTQALQLDQWESFASPTEARAGLEEAFGVENLTVELGALQVYLSRYAATDAVVEPDLGPRLEAMKAFLARYPSRKTAATPTPEKSEERVEAPTSPAPPLTGPTRCEQTSRDARSVGRRPGASKRVGRRPGASRRAGRTSSSRRHRTRAGAAIPSRTCSTGGCRAKRS